MKWPAGLELGRGLALSPRLQVGQTRQRGSCGCCCCCGCCACGELWVRRPVPYAGLCPAELACGCCGEGASRKLGGVGKPSSDCSLDERRGSVLGVELTSASNCRSEKLDTGLRVIPTPAASALLDGCSCMGCMACPCCASCKGCCAYMLGSACRLLWRDALRRWLGGGGRSAEEPLGTSKGDWPGASRGAGLRKRDK